MAWPVDMSLTSGGTSSEPNEKSLPEFDASEALEIVFSRAAVVAPRATARRALARCESWERRLRFIHWRGVARLWLIC